MLITNLNVAYWRQAVGYVPQSISMLDTSLLKNIAFAVNDENIDLNRVNSSIEDADIKDLISSSPDRLNAEIGEAGARISGGQRQRVALARALYRDFQFIVFDEVTSALDSETQDRVMKAISKIKNNAAVVIITHNEDILSYCDKICVLKNGRVDKFGPRDDLLI